MASTAFGQARKARIDRQYAELRAIDPGELRAIVARASAIGMNHRLDAIMPSTDCLALLADIESALVEVALRNRQGGE